MGTMTLALFDKGVEEGFIDNSARNIVVMANTAEELIKKMEVGRGKKVLCLRLLNYWGGKTDFCLKKARKESD